MSRKLPDPARAARGVRSFEAARHCGPAAWEFDWEFGSTDSAFRGHFPHQPILPGVFLVEMAMRAAEYALRSELGIPGSVHCVERFRFLNAILPGDACRLRIEWTAKAAPVGSLELRVSFSKPSVRVAHGVLRVGESAPAELVERNVPCRVAESPGKVPLRILRSMPHRYPMLLIDDIEGEGEADSAVAYKNITFNEACFNDIDSSNATADDLSYPPSLLMESFGQGAGLLLARRGFLDRAGSSGAVVFGQFEGIEFVAPAFPGDRLRHDVRLLQAVGTLVILSGQSVVGRRVVARFARLKAFLVSTAAVAQGTKA